MADTTGPGQGLDEVTDPAYDVKRFVKRLLIERHGIRAAIESPGGSIILAASSLDLDALKTYSSVIGNDWHLDLIEAERLVNELPREQRIALLAWCDGMSPQDAAVYVSKRTGSRKSTDPHAAYKRIDRAAGKVAEGMGDETLP